jgi:hypothetical protein
MVNHLKRGKALRGTLTLTDLVCDVSQSSLKSETSAESMDQCHPNGHGNGDRGQPVLPSAQRLGSRKERTGQGEEHATYIVSLESYTLNTGSFLRDVKGNTADIF